MFRAPRRSKVVVAFALSLSLVFAACAGDEPTTGSPTALKVGVLFLGPISDADWNATHNESIQTVANSLGADVSFTENVSVPDAKRVAKQYIAQEMDAVILSSSAYFPASMELAQEFPDTNFVTLIGGPQPEDQPENLWLFGLNFYPGEYVIGALDALASEKGKIAFVGGLDLPSLIAGANGYFEGAKAMRPNIELDYLFTGDFDDASKARDGAAALIRRGSDVLHVHLNAGVPGVVEAVQAAQGIKWSALYTDKNDLGPDTYLGSIEFDFQQGYQEALSAIEEGTTTGYLDLGPLISLTNLYNIDDDVRSEVEEILEKVKSGEITIEPNAEEVVVP